MIPYLSPQDRELDPEELAEMVFLLRRSEEKPTP